MNRRTQRDRRPIAVHDLYSADPRAADPHEPFGSSDSRRRAVALRYRVNESEAPVVRAKGSGHLADRILSMAREHDIPVQKDPALVEVLAKLDVGSLIPPDLYRAVADLLAMVYQTERRFRRSSRR